MADEAKGWRSFLAKPGPWVDLGLTLPIFLLYHLGVVFLSIRNASDVVTGLLLRVAEGSKELYIALTILIGAAFGGIFYLLGRGQTFKPRKFLQIGIEGIVYAVLLRIAGSYVVGALFAGKAGIKSEGPLTGFIMSCGAGFYEEITFRVILFGLGAKGLVWLLARQKVEMVQQQKVPLNWRAFGIMIAWALVCAAIFSGVHYVGALSDDFQLASFTFRLVLGLILTLIYALRGFAAAVWAHALYDVWVLVF
jgi:hypothetical protein